MTSQGKNKSNPSGGGPAPKAGKQGGSQRPAYKGGNKARSQSGARGPGSGVSPIMFWTLAFVAVAVVIVASAVYLSQPQPQATNAAGLNIPIVVTPANLASSGRTLGDPSAPVTIDLYGDFRCTACQAFTVGGSEDRLVSTYVATNKAKLVWHDYLIIDQNHSGQTASRDAANAAYCAADQGKFWTMHDWLFANQSSSEDPSAFSSSRLSAIGNAAGLDMTQFQPCLDQGTHDAEISAASATAAKTINSTPTVYVNGKAVNQPGQGVSYDMIKAAIDAALAAPAPSPS
jgi:protein-disulfide isomerase